MAGRRRDPRRRHHRDLDGQRPTPGEPQRRRHPDHRHRAAGEGARRDRPRRRPDRTGRHHTGGVAAQAVSRQRVRPRACRCRTVQLLQAGKPHRPARNGAAVAGRPGRRGTRQIPRRQTHHRYVGGPRAGGRRRHRRGGVRNPCPARVPDRIEIQCGADGGPRRARRRAVRRLGAPDGQGAGAGHQPGRHRAHGGRRRRPRSASRFRPRDERHAAGDRHIAPVTVGADLRRGHRRRGRSTVGQDRRAHGHPRGGQARPLVVIADSPSPAHGVLARRIRRPVRHLRAHRLAARPVPRRRRGERAVLHRGAGRRAARRRGPRRTVRRAVGSAAELFPRRAAAYLHHRGTRQRDHRRRAACRRGRRRRARGRRRQTGQGGHAGFPRSRTPRAVRRFGAAGRRPGHAARAGPRDLRRSVP